MAPQPIVRGTKFRLNRSSANPVASPAVYNYVCSGTTINFSQKLVLEDATVADCAAPNSTPNRQAVVKERQWDLSFSGKADPLGFEMLEGDQGADVPYPYQLILDLTGAAGGKTWSGSAYITDLTLTKTENGILSFTATMQGDGAIVTAALS